MLLAINNTNATSEQIEKHINDAGRYLGEIKYNNTTSYNQAIRFYFKIKQKFIENGKLNGTVQDVTKEAADFTRNFIFKDFDVSLISFSLAKYYDYISSEGFIYEREKSHLDSLHKFYRNNYSDMYPEIGLLFKAIFQEEEKAVKKHQKNMAGLFDTLFEDEE